VRTASIIALVTEAVRTSETSVYSNDTTERYILKTLYQLCSIQRAFMYASNSGHSVSGGKGTMLKFRPLNAVSVRNFFIIHVLCGHQAMVGAHRGNNRQA
jgi:hypothetical protein